MSFTQPHQDPEHAVEAHDEDYGSDLANDDIHEVVPEHDQEGDIPMDDDSDDEGAQQEDGQDSAPDQEEFVDNSIAAFYSHRKSVFSVSLHPSYPNPPLALSGGEDDGGWIWNTQDGSEVVRLGGHTDSVTSALFNAAGDLAATGGMDGKVRIWRKRSDDFKTWEFLTNLEGPDEIIWIDWHPKGSVLAAGGADSTVWMWQLPSGNVMNVFSGHSDAVACGSFTPDGKRLVTGAEDGTLIVWDPRSAEVVSKVQTHLDGGVIQLAVSPDARVVVIGGAAGDVRVVNISALDNGGSASVVASLNGHAESESIEGIQFVDVGGGNRTGHVITASTDGKAIVWDLSLAKMRCEVMHDAAITAIALHPGTTLFSTSSADHTIKTWDARTGGCVATQQGFTDGVLALAVGKDDGFTQGAETGGIGAYTNTANSKGWKLVGAGDEGVALVFRV
ncbi:related to Angio-associated migratory cell protein [Melanopsichium pennsylvanicum]|uniref:Related to Angio-associated migratory cell protein n=2 Tax=Melanopsichium pennsylvanicum TaxID=63383 RepID=A0AAJ5C8J9_9BASI|nr:related to Angio-associated migratory cell protein [Melanopsichium pennsylvanicum 4]SNX88051.1 related to Angio-associated migratory cell protein [Melanopsichium pennsylvanicum]